MQDPKLTVELIPASMWGANLREILPSRNWDILRSNCYRAAGHKCEVCYKGGFKGRVECHERWEIKFHGRSFTQKLLGVICLCPTCHMAKHIGRTLSSAPHRAQAVYAKLREVNGWTQDEANAHIEGAFKVFNFLSQWPGELDVTWLDANEEMWSVRAA